jgi:hypothetical protein
MNIRQIRTEDVTAIARVHIDTWRTTFAGIVPQDYLDQLTYAESEEIWTEILQGEKGDRPFFVAEIPEKQVVGFILGGANRLTDYPSHLGGADGHLHPPIPPGPGFGAPLDTNPGGSYAPASLSLRAGLDTYAKPRLSLL